MPKERQINDRWSGIKRITSMGTPELADRSRQALAKRVDAILSAMGVDLSHRETRKGKTGSSRFFFGTEDVPQLTNLLQERMPQQVEAIIKCAEKICQHRFDLLGYKDLDYGKEIDWHLDGVHRKRAPRDFWFKIKYLDFSSVGDAKVTWELNRHQHLVTLGKAYRLTNDARFASELISQWRHWQKENPYPRGINWTSSLEVAFRSLSWLWVYFLLERTPVMTPELREQWLRTMALSGRHIEHYLSTYFSPNTHLLGEGVALFFIGTLCPELRSSKRWRKRGWEIVLRESERQVRPDGFYFEQSTYYHVYALDFLIHARVLASLNDVLIPPEYDRGIERMLNTLALLCRAGAPPRWGDDDGGRVFDPQRNRAEHLSDPLATGASLFGRADFKFLSGGLREETVWLLGEKGVAQFDHLEAKPPEMTSVALPDAGLYVMSCSERKLQAVIDAGPQGALAAGHRHADALSVTIHAEGRELLGDPGTYQYVGPGTDREHFRGSAAHNTLQLDERAQSEPKGPFAWNRLTETKVERWINGLTFDLFVGSHDGYARPQDPFTHRRWVFFRKASFWLVRDLVLGKGKHKLDVRWHINPELTCSEISGTQYLCSGRGVGISLFAVDGHVWSSVAEQSSWSSAYGRKELATAVRFMAETALPAEFVTLLKPTGTAPNDVSTQVKLTQSSPSPDTAVYHFADIRDEHCFVFSQGQGWSFDEWKSDAEFLYLCTTNGKPKLLVVCNGTYVEFREMRIASAQKRANRFEITSVEGKMRTISSENEIIISPETNKWFETGHTVSQAGGKAEQ